MFKSFFDLLDNTALVGKPVLIGATGGSSRHSLVLEYAPPRSNSLARGHPHRPLFAYLRAVVVPTGVYGASEDWGAGGDGRTDALAHRVRRAADEPAGLMGGRPAVAEPTETVVPFEQQLAALRSA